MSPGLLSFVGDDFESIFRYADHFFPGISRIAGIYYSGNEARLRIISCQRGEDICHADEHILGDREQVILIQRHRTHNIPFEWISREDVPFEFAQDRRKIKDIFSEIENVVLVLRFKNELDRQYDILYMYFNKNFGNFGIKQAEKVLTVDNKLIIANLLYHQFKTFFTVNRENLRLIKGISNNVRSVIRENKSLKEQLHVLKNSFGESMVNLAEQHLAELSDKRGITYSLSGDATEKIREFKGNPKHMPAILENAISFIENLGMGTEEPGVLNAQALDFDSYQAYEKTEHFSRKIDSRQSRAMQLLDRLETAAMAIRGRNQPLKSASIGKELDPPITAPAITDALAKNSDTILRLLDRYPERWEVIRKDFRPLHNLVNKKTAEKFDKAGA